MIFIFVLLIILILFTYLFWKKLKIGKPGRISGYIVENKKYEEALVVDVRWRKEYEKSHAVNAINVPIKVLKNNSKILDDYKNKDIILYCVVDITSRNTEKILRQKGFTKIHIGDGVKQYNYKNLSFKNVLMSEMKYLRTVLNHKLLNLGKEELENSEMKCKIEDVNKLDFNKEEFIFIYSDVADESLEASKILVKKGYKIINLIEPMNIKKYTFTTYSKKDFIENNKNYDKNDCG